MGSQPATNDQAGFALRFDWGPVGAAVLGACSDVVIVVDVLSFTTAVSVAAERGGTVTPIRWGDDRGVADAIAAGAVHAMGYEARSSERPWTIAPSSLLHLPHGARLAMPSPNGATIAEILARLRTTVIAGCLRNASAVARAARSLGRTVAVIAAGERWPDGSLRPSAEDLLGSGLILGRLAELEMGPLSPEARAAVAAAHLDDIPSQIRDCASGRELLARDHAADVDLAAEIDVSETVPILHRGAFTAHPPAGNDRPSPHPP
jgi:2-phosphosulfolactate phosphatase